MARAGGSQERNRLGREGGEGEGYFPGRGGSFFLGVDFIERVFDRHTFRMGHQIDMGIPPKPQWIFVSTSKKKKISFSFCVWGGGVGHYFNETKCQWERRDYIFLLSNPTCFLDTHMLFAASFDS